MRFALLACLVLALVPFSIHAEEQANQPSQQKQKGASPPQTQAAPSAATSSVISQPTAEGVNKGKAEKQTYLHHVLAPEILPNWLLLFVALMGVLLAWRTLKDLEKQTSDFHTAAQAAKKSADVAESALHLAERADVLLESASFTHGRVVDTKDSKVILQFRNFGRTKAKNVKLTLNLIIEGVPSTDSTHIPAITMGAGETQTISSQRFVEFMTQETAQGIFSGKTLLRFEASAVYQDIFSEDSHRSYYTGTLDKSTDVFRIDKHESD